MTTTATARVVAELIETYRQGFLKLDPERLGTIWDQDHAPLVYVAMEKSEPMYGWAAIERYYAALPEHLEKIVAKKVDNVSIDPLGDTAVAFFKFHSTVKLKAHEGLYRPSSRVTMLFRHTQAGWRLIHYHESALAAQTAKNVAERSVGAKKKTAATAKRKIIAAK
jgi:ketosteroid isomerase-like protein